MGATLNKVSNAIHVISLLLAGWLAAVAFQAEADVVWQIGELGKVDAGGGGTVAKYIARLNVDVVDLGVPVLSMHAPYEVIAKFDLWAAFRAFDEFFKQ